MYITLTTKLHTCTSEVVCSYLFPADIIGECSWEGETKLALSPLLIGVEVINWLVLPMTPPSRSPSVLSGLDVSCGLWGIGILEETPGRVRKIEGEKVVLGGFRGLRGNCDRGKYLGPSGVVSILVGVFCGLGGGRI